MPTPDTHVGYRGKPYHCSGILTAFPGRQRNVGCCKAGGAIIGEKLGRNGKQEMKGENKPSQIPTQLLSLANALGFRPIKLSDRMNCVFSNQPNLRHETVAPSPQLTLDQHVKRLKRSFAPGCP